MFTSVKDTDLYMLYSLSDAELYNICHTDQYFKQLCTSDHILNDKLAKHTAFIRATHFINAVESYMKNDPDPIYFTLIHHHDVLRIHPELLPDRLQSDIEKFRPDYEGSHNDFIFFGMDGHFLIELNILDDDDDAILSSSYDISKISMINILSTYLYYYPKEYQSLI